MASFDISFSSDEELQMIFESSEDIETHFDSTVRIGDFNPYEGEYEFTPSDSEQVISTEALLMRHDIIIHAIPQTYGHVGWDGATLTIY